MPEAVISENEVSLNAVRYRIAGPVHRTLASVYPGKTVIGDYTKDSSPILSTLSLSDHRGGIGLDIMTGDGDTDRSWYSTADTRYKGHLILPPLLTTTAGLPTGLSSIGALAEYRGGVYANVIATSSGVYLYNGTNSWGAVLVASTGLSSSWATLRMGSAYYLIIGGVSEYIYFDNTSWVVDTANAPFVAAWQERLWAVDTVAASLWYSLALGTEVTEASIPSPLSSTSDGELFVARDAAGEEILYLALADGLYAHDVANARFIPTGLQIPMLSALSSGGWGFVAACRWRDKIYFAARSTIFEYDVGSPSGATIRRISPDVDDGLPSVKGYIIGSMIPAANDLIAVAHGNLATGTETTVILAWNGRGWRVLHEGAVGDAEDLRVLLAAGAYGDYRLWFANNTTSPYNISYLATPADMKSPLQISTYTYAAAATHDWPWFTAGQADVTKVAVRVKVETTNPTTSETVKVYYAINRSTTFQIMTNSTYTNGTITAAGIQTFDFPSVDSWVSTTARTGTAFRSIQFRVVYARGGTTTNTPDVLSLTLEFYKKLDAKWQFQASFDLNNDYKGNTPKQLRAALLTAQETATLLEFTYRDPDTNSDATFYVQAQPVEGEEMTGVDERGNLTLQLREV